MINKKDIEQQGFSDGCDRRSPQHPNNKKYMAEYFEGLGMADGYADTQPQLWSNPSYRNGYLMASYERYCHSYKTSKWVVEEVNIKGKIVICRYPVDRPRPWWQTPWR